MGCALYIIIYWKSSIFEGKNPNLQLVNLHEIHQAWYHSMWRKMFKRTLTVQTRKQVSEQRSPKHMFRVCTDYKNFVLKDSIVTLALPLHKQLTHHLNHLFSRNPMSLVLLPLNKACKSYGTLFRWLCNIYAKQK